MAADRIAGSHAPSIAERMLHAWRHWRKSDVPECWVRQDHYIQELRADAQMAKSRLNALREWQNRHGVDDNK